MNRHVRFATRPAFENEPTMMTSDDESSRDSGICVMEEGSPTCFSSMHSGYDNNAMEVEEGENMMVARSPPKRRKRATLRREKSSCHVRLFDESPNSRTMFVRPMFANRQNQDPLSRNTEQRKRSMDAETGELVPTKSEKREKALHASDHYHLGSMDVGMDEDTQFDAEQQGIQAACAFQSTSAAAADRMGSTFQRHHSTAVMQREKEAEMEMEDDNHLVVNYHLNTIPTKCSTSYRRISAETLCELMQRISELEFREKYILIDCRYPFEYDGGHIKNAINFFDRDKVSTLFFDDKGKRRFKKIPIFYCEFSQKRGPSMAYALREDDRKRNILMYPKCAYEEMYVLDKGFRNFYKFATFTNMQSLCEPFNYVEMSDPNHTNELKGWNFHRRAAVGQTMLRAESQTTALFRSSTTSAASSSSSSSITLSSLRSSSNDMQGSQTGTSEDKDKTTPAGTRRENLQFRRNLFQSSPTSFSRPGPLDKRHSSTPPTDKRPVAHLQFS